MKQNIQGNVQFFYNYLKRKIAVNLEQLPWQLSANGFNCYRSSNHLPLLTAQSSAALQWTQSDQDQTEPSWQKLSPIQSTW